MRLCISTVECSAGFIDRHGKWVVKPEFEEVGCFHDGLARVSILVPGKGHSATDEVGQEPRYGYVDKTGKLVVPPVLYQAVPSFSEGLAKRHCRYQKLAGDIAKIRRSLTRLDAPGNPNWMAAPVFSLCDLSPPQNVQGSVDANFFGDCYMRKQKPGLVLLILVLVGIAFLCGMQFSGTPSQAKDEAENLPQLADAACPKCKGPMEVGTLLDYWDTNGVMNAEFSSKVPDLHLFAKRPRKFKVTGYHCTNCGFLEMYGK